MKRWLSVLCLLAGAAGLFAADKKSEITAQATSLYVRKPLQPKKTAPAAFIDKGGAGLGVTLSVPGKFVLGIDAKASKLDHFQDDKGTKLFAPGGFVMATSWLSEVPQISADGEQCTVNLNANVPPAKGALKLDVKATVVLKCGADEKTTDAKKIAIKKNQMEKVGDYTIQVVNEGSPFGGPQIAITSDKQNIKSAEFVDGKGNAIKLPFPAYRQSFAPAPGQMKHGLFFNLPKKVESVSVKVTYFSKTEDVQAPIELNVGIGLE